MKDGERGACWTGIEGHEGRGEGGMMDGERGA